jgi:hypothetical protein
MAALVVDGGDLVVRLSPLEKICTFRGNVRVPLAAVRAASVDPQPWRSLLSLRRVRISPGAGIPGVLTLGTCGFGRDRAFVAVHGRRPAVRVDLDIAAAHFSQLLVTVPDPEATVTAIMAVTA